MSPTASVDAALERLRASSEDCHFFGPAPAEAVEKLEALLGVRLPPSFRHFLRACGGGGVGENGISGIVDGDPELETLGNVWCDTKRCREEYELPPHLVVIYFHDDEVCWCLDGSKPAHDGELPVVSYSVFHQGRRVDGKIAPTFAAFFTEYVSLRVE